MVKIEHIIQASFRLNGIVEETPLQRNLHLSERYNANIYLKREDLQVVRSYKIRGAYNLISKLNAETAQKGVVCASAGNHAQGFAYSCYLLGIEGKIYMPSTTPLQKIKQVEFLGKDKVSVVLTGDTFDDAHSEAVKYAETQGKTLVPPFDHTFIIEGQGTVGVEILNQFKEEKIDYLFVPIGGGGLCAGVGSYFDKLSPETKIIGVEPTGAAAMKKAFDVGEVITLDEIDTFVDGAAVRRVGTLNYPICKQVVEEITLVDEGKICTFILQMYNRDAIVVEPAGVLSVAALDDYQMEIRGKNVVCILSGGNNDIERMPEIKERSLLYEGLKHYFIVMFPQRSGALRQFLDKVLGPEDDIVHFEYTKRTSRTLGPALVGIQLQNAKDYDGIVKRMEQLGFDFKVVNEDNKLFSFLV